MAVEKDLLNLSKNIVEKREEGFLEREYPDRKERVKVKNLMDEIYYGEVNSREDMVRLYREGVTCSELGKLMGRTFQSVSRSVRNIGGEDIVREHRENRKKMVYLMKKYYIVYYSDISGGYDWLMSEYGVTLEKAKDMYRRAGGKVLIKRSRVKDKNTDKEIKLLMEEGYTGVEISRAMDMPVTTVYYRINNRIISDEDRE